MKVRVLISKLDCEVKLSTRTMKKYAQQGVGVLFPDEEYPIADKALVELNGDMPKPFPVGEYTADASISKSPIGFELSVNYRTLVPVAPAVKKAA